MTHRRALWSLALILCGCQGNSGAGTGDGGAALGGMPVDAARADEATPDGGGQAPGEGMRDKARESGGEPFDALPGNGDAASPDLASGSEAPANGYPDAAKPCTGGDGNLDLVFMIDNSPSMSDKQDLLARNMSELTKALRAGTGRLPNLHVAVVSSDVGAGAYAIPGNSECSRGGGDKGNFLARPTCGVRSDRPYITATDDGTRTNLTTGTLDEAMQCLVRLGTFGCGFEHQLQSIRLATIPDYSPSAWEFFREDAFLAIVMLTDEDDCSAPPDSALFTSTTLFDFTKINPNTICPLVGDECGGAPVPAMSFRAPLESCAARPQPIPATTTSLYDVSEFVDFFRRIKPADRFFVSLIGGWPANGQTQGLEYVLAPSGPTTPPLLNVAGVCQNSAGAKGFPALRLKKFVDAFGDHGSLDSVCADDYGPTFARIGSRLSQVMKASCGPSGG